MEKTCGNCHWYHEDSRGIGIGACLNMNSERMCSGNFFPCTNAKNYPCDHHASESSTLDQRYQQLAEVARDLFNRAYEFNRDGSCLGGIYIADFREKLEELGVSIDD